MAWEVTARCNLHCIHCRAAAGSDIPEGIFTLERARAFLDHIAEFASPVIVLTGGEPLLHAHLPEIMAHGTSKGFRMCLATNGTLLTGKVCGRLIDAGVKMVSLSLDGATASVHDDFRQQEGAFEGAMQGISCLKRNGIPFLINSSFTQRNLSDVESTFELAKRLGAKAWYMFCVVPVGRGEEITAELLSPEQYRDLLNWHIEMERREEENGGTILVRPTCAPQYYRLIAEAQAAGRPVARRSLSFSTGGAKGCVAGQSIVLIEASGDVKPCSYFPEAAGTILTTPFQEIWSDAELFRKLRDPASYTGVCGKCPHLSVCGGCRVRAHFAGNGFFGQDPLCLKAFGSPLKDAPSADKQ